MKKEAKVMAPVAESNDTKSDAPAPPQVREMSWEEFEEANRKAGVLHDGLFRRLAEHDRQR